MSFHCLSGLRRRNLPAGRTWSKYKFITVRLKATDYGSCGSRALPIVESMLIILLTHLAFATARCKVSLDQNRTAFNAGDRGPDQVRRKVVCGAGVQPDVHIGHIAIIAKNAGAIRSVPPSCAPDQWIATQFKVLPPVLRNSRWA